MTTSSTGQDTWLSTGLLSRPCNYLATQHTDPTQHSGEWHTTRHTSRSLRTDVSSGVLGDFMRLRSGCLSRSLRVLFLLGLHPPLLLLQPSPRRFYVFCAVFFIPSMILLRFFPRAFSLSCDSSCAASSVLVATCDPIYGFSSSESTSSAATC